MASLLGGSVLCTLDSKHAAQAWERLVRAAKRGDRRLIRKAFAYLESLGRTQRRARECPGPTGSRA